MKTKKLNIFLVFLLAFAITIPLLSAETIEYEWKYETNGNITLSSPLYTSCILKPTATNDGYKICNAVIQGTSDGSLLNATNFHIEIESGIVKDDNYTYYFSNEYNTTYQTMLNKTCYDALPEFNETSVNSCVVNITRKEYYNWKPLPDTYSDTDFAYMASFEALQDNTTNYNFSITYDGIGEIILDPMLLGSCGSISSSGEYALTGDVSSFSTCFMITSSNVILDGKDPFSPSNVKPRKITWGTMNGGFANAINIQSSTTNITIKNIAMEFGGSPTASSFNHGIYISGFNSNIHIINNTISLKNQFSTAINTFFIKNSTFINNEIWSQGNQNYGIGLTDTDISIPTNITIKDNYVFATQNALYFQNYIKNSIISGNYLASTSYSINGGTFSASNNLFINNNLNVIGFTGFPPVYALSSTNNTFIYNNSYGNIEWNYNQIYSAPSQVFLQDNWIYRFRALEASPPPTPNNFTGGYFEWFNGTLANNRPIYNNSNGYYLSFEACGYINTWSLSDAPAECPMMWLQAGSGGYYPDTANNLYNSFIGASGSVNVTRYSTGNIIIANNFASGNAFSGSFPAGIITLNNVPTNFTQPIILKNGVKCPVGECTNLTDLNAGIVRFSVTSFSNYSIGEGYVAPVPIEEACEDIVAGLGSFNNLMPILIIIGFSVIVVGLFLGFKQGADSGVSIGQVLGNMNANAIVALIGALVVAGLISIVGIVIVSQLGGC
jgi:hypothetical protein